MHTNAIRIHQYGDASVLRWESVELPPPGAGEAQVRHRAVGLNFIDIYQRTGLYPLPGLPSGLGLEGAGVVESLGPGVDGLAPGDRVAYAGGPVGAYAEALFDVVTSGAVRVEINQTFSLAEAARAHEALEGRRTSGSTVLIV